MVGDGDAMGVAAQVLQHIFRATEGWFGIDHPVLTKQGRRIADLVRAISAGQTKHRCPTGPKNRSPGKVRANKLALLLQCQTDDKRKLYVSPAGEAPLAPSGSRWSAIL